MPSCLRPPADEARQRRDQPPVLVLKPDADAQAARQAVAAHLARDDALGLEPGVGGTGVAPAAGGKLDQQEVAQAGVGAQPELRDLPTEPRQPGPVVGAGLFGVRLVLEGGYAGRLG